MTKLIKKIRAKLNAYLKFTNRKKYNLQVKNVVVVYDTTLDEDFQKALSILKDDFSIETLDLASKALTKDHVKAFDFVILYTSFEDKVFAFSKTIKRLNTPIGVYLNRSDCPNFKINYNNYDLIWGASYFLLEKINHDILKLHALGVDLEKTIKAYESDAIKRVLMARYRNLPFEKTNDDSIREFYKSPIWDIQYVSDQLRTGMVAFEEHRIRRTHFIKSSRNVKVGRNSFYNSNLLLTGDTSIEIGAFCAFGKNISIYTSNHDTNYPSIQGYVYRKYFNEDHPGERLDVPSLSRSKGPVVIKNDVWIGDGVKIMSGVTIGNGACIAAGSIVTSNVEDYSVVAGIPAKRLKYRFDEEIRKVLLEVKWWDWSDYKMSKNKAFFDLNLNEISSPTLILEQIN